MIDSRNTPPKRLARVTGLWYLGWTLVGFYGMLWVSPRVMVKGDAGATAKNILEHDLLYRSQIFSGLVGTAIAIVLVMYLYRLFREVDRNLAILMGGLLLITMPSGIITSALQLGVLDVVKGADLQSFETLQRQDAAMFLLQSESYLTTASILFWGLWLFPLGLLVYRSRFLPRFLGAWLLVNGAAYVVLSMAGVLYPQYQQMVFSVAIPAMLGEGVFQLWLMFRGLNEQSWLESPHNELKYQ